MTCKYGSYRDSNESDSLYIGNVVFSNGERYRFEANSLNSDFPEFGSVYKNSDEIYDTINSIVSENEITLIEKLDEETLDKLYSLICSADNDINPTEKHVSAYSKTNIIICFKKDNANDIQAIHIKTFGAYSYVYDDIYRDEIIYFFANNNS